MSGILNSSGGILGGIGVLELPITLTAQDGGIFQSNSVVDDEIQIGLISSVDGQIPIGSAVDLSAFVVDNSAAVKPIESTGSGILLTGKGDHRSALESLRTIDSCNTVNNDRSVINGVVAVEGHCGVVTAVNVRAGVVDHIAFVSAFGCSSGAESTSSFDGGAAVKGDGSFAAHGSGDVGGTGNVEGIGKSVCSCNGQITIAAAVNIGRSLIDNGRIARAADGGAALSGSGIGRAAESNGNIGINSLISAQCGNRLDLHTVTEGVCTDNCQLTVSSADDPLISSTIVGNTGGGGTIESSGSTVTAAENQRSGAAESLYSGDSQLITDVDGLIGNSAISFKLQRRIETVVKCHTFLISDGSGVGGSISAESSGSACLGSFLEGHICCSGLGAVDVECSGNAEVIGKSVTAHDLQVAVGTAENVRISIISY